MSGSPVWPLSTDESAVTQLGIALARLYGEGAGKVPFLGDAHRLLDVLAEPREALDLLDEIDSIVDDTHPEGDGCPLCSALDDLRAVLERGS